MDPRTPIPAPSEARLRSFLLTLCGAGGGCFTLREGLEALLELCGAEVGWFWCRGEAGWQPLPALPEPPPGTEAPLECADGQVHGRSQGGREWLLLPLESGPDPEHVLQVGWSEPPLAPDPELLCAVACLLLATRGPDGESGETERLRAVLEHSERLSQLGKMAAGIAHEVGNPLAGISSIVQTLLLRTEDETARERLLLVKEQVGRINAIIRQLVEYSRPSTERRRPTDLNELVRGTARLMRFEPRARGVDLTLELDDRLPAVPVTAHQVQQVFLNLFHNAIDATEGGSWRSVRVHSGRAGDFAVFTVEDNGCGIPAADLARVLDPFFTTKEPGRGTGLGLWICQGILESLAGDLQLESRPGQGTRVTVRIRIPNEAEHPGR
ncbi:MAG: ATP-binding protein [Candidatus Delongbacteria bacterium]